jgi:hypothetical protein
MLSGLVHGVGTGQSQDGDEDNEDLGGHCENFKVLLLDYIQRDL